MIRRALIAVAALGFFASWLAPVTMREAQAAPPANAFTLLPETWDVAVSPSGRYVAIVSNKSSATGESQLIVGELAGKKIDNLVVMALGDWLPIGVDFKSDDRLIVSVVVRGMRVTNVQVRDPEDAKFDKVAQIAINRDGSNSVVLMEGVKFGVFVQNILRADPEHIMVTALDRSSGAPALYKVNINTGAAERTELGISQGVGSSRDRGRIRTIGFQTNSQGVAFVRVDVDDRRDTLITRIRAAGSTQWLDFRENSILENSQRDVIAGMSSPTTMIVLERGSEDRRQAWEYDLTTGQRVRQIMSYGQGEATSPFWDSYEDTLIGGEWTVNGLPVQVFTVPELKAAQEALKKSFPEFSVHRFISRSADGRVLVVRSEAGTTPAVFLVFDLKAMTIATAGFASRLDPKQLGTSQAIQYKSSDGRTITAILTLPAGGRTNLPMVVMPHGGPEAQDTLDYSPWRAFLASRGYAVLEPQFRGGEGYGLAHERGGHGNWGTLVQDDATFGVRHVIAQGIADPSRICIFGWSYGGYMAMAGAGMSPDLYRCVIAGAGVSDLPAMLQFTEAEGDDDSVSYKYWSVRMGNAEQQERGSPTRFAANVRAPVLLIHGERDDVVPISQSELFAAALDKAGKPYEFLRLPKSEHTPRDEEELQMLQAVDAFLAKHLPR